MSIESRLQPLVDRFVQELTDALKEEVVSALGGNGARRRAVKSPTSGRRGRRSRFEASKLVPLLSKDGKPLGKLVEESRGTKAQVQIALRKLKKEGKAKMRGNRRSALWFAA